MIDVYKHKERVLKVISDHFDEREILRKRIIPEDPVMESVRKSIGKGKLFRSMCLCTTYELISGKEPDDNIFFIAAAIEIIHMGLLIHDDIIDRSPMRRGEISTVESYHQKFKNTVADSHHLATSLAICVADICYFSAMGLIAKSSHSSKAMAFLSKEIELVGYAEMADVYIGSNVTKNSIEEIINVHRYKTGRYTFSMPLVLGATLANPNEEDLEALDMAGENLGTYFQIIDDELGLIGKEEEIGKPVGSDISEDKKTLQRYFLFEDASSEDRNELAKIFGKNPITSNELDLVSGYLKKYDTIAKTRAYAEKFLQDISIDKCPKRLQDFIKLLIDLNKGRTK